MGKHSISQAMRTFKATAIGFVNSHGLTVWLTWEISGVVKLILVYLLKRECFRYSAFVSRRMQEAAGVLSHHRSIV